MGTDIQVFENEKDKAQVHLNPLAHYKPNLHFECHDRLLGGDIGLSTKNNEISYTKLYEVQGLELGVSALYNYAERVPYAGFVLHSTSGVSSAAKSNAFSINHSMDLDFMPVDTKLQFQGEVALPGTKFDTKTGTVGLTVRPRAARASQGHSRSRAVHRARWTSSSTTSSPPFRSERKSDAHGGVRAAC